MKKFFLMVIALTFVLIGCEKEGISVNEEYTASTSDFKVGFMNKDNQVLGHHEAGGMFVYAGYSTRIAGENIATALDSLLTKEGVERGERLEKIYPDAKIKTNGSKYIVTLEKGLELEFEKVGQRIIKDSFGIEYSTSAYPE